MARHEEGKTGDGGKQETGDSAGPPPRPRAASEGRAAWGREPRDRIKLVGGIQEPGWLAGVSGTGKPWSVGEVRVAGRGPLGLWFSHLPWAGLNEAAREPILCFKGLLTWGLGLG